MIGNSGGDRSWRRTKDEKSGTYFLTMEYALSQLFKIVSTYGRGEEDSGLELKWSRRY